MAAGRGRTVIWDASGAACLLAAWPCDGILRMRGRQAAAADALPPSLHTAQPPQPLTDMAKAVMRSSCCCSTCCGAIGLCVQASRCGHGGGGCAWVAAPACMRPTMCARPHHYEPQMQSKMRAVTAAVLAHCGRLGCDRHAPCALHPSIHHMGTDLAGHHHCGAGDICKRHRAHGAGDCLDGAQQGSAASTTKVG